MLKCEWNAIKKERSQVSRGGKSLLAHSVTDGRVLVLLVVDIERLAQIYTVIYKCSNGNLSYPHQHGHG